MGGSPLRLGPFIGGLNTTSDPTAIADAELVECTNMELDIDGSLISRPGFVELDGYSSFSERILLLCEGVFSGNHYIIASNADGVFQYLSGVWTLITNTFQASVAVQYANKIYLVPKPGSANPGGKWDPVGGFTAIAAIPQGQAGVLHKERLFIVPGELATTNPSRLKFSDVGDLETWGASSFIDINQGDGTNLVDLTIFQDNIILFKAQSSYVLAYDTKPTDAVVRKISLTLGVNKQFNVVNYENSIYIFSGGWVYEVINYDFRRLNTKVPFVRDDTTPSAFSSENVFLTLLGDRLICHFHRNIYVYGLRTRTWSLWKSERDELQYFGPILTIHPSTGDEYYSGQCITNFRSLIKFYIAPSVSSIETVLNPTYTILDTFTRSISNGWGTADTGQVWTVSGGIAANYAVSGTKGTFSMTTVNVVRSATLGIINAANQDIQFTVESSAVALGATILVEFRYRVVDANNFYALQLLFQTGGTLVILLYKVVAGSVTTLGSATFGSYSANEQFSVRLLANSTAIKAKVWRTVGLEPNGYNLSFTDSGVTAAGGFSVNANLTAGNTNTLPVTIRFDNYKFANPSNGLVRTISTRILTKNYDMSVSHQFKRLWWWGADVATNNTITGTATPIVLFFKASWSNLAAKQWNQVQTWDIPLDSLSSEQTVIPTGTGTARRFAKFNKSLRYRQINFVLELTTNGSTADGPARVFSMTIITETKEVVTKAVS